ncbi:Protein kinase-like domain protein [Niveomyces insectorum RCEF 264]|uniref:Protein kinase-like domain protein n=1 Tax=Niveomyces insectorum RCEF 264 TaxID=1081102 RepID=A0A167UKQ6_9HYPO|nr:Protein kinase-like domain protein [Niveomyces insectorum RCEF 264]
MSPSIATLKAIDKARKAAREIPDDVPHCNTFYPITAEQQDERREAFINSIDTDAVCRLASRHNHGRPCRIFRPRARGSFNVCFFVEFDGDGNGDGDDDGDNDKDKDKVRWVVRFPITQTVFNAWEKIRNEVATLRYLAHNTKIPVPRVHAFAPAGPVGGDEANPTGLAFLILGYIAGTPLDIKAFDKAPREKKTHLYEQLIDIYAELYAQEFDRIGSLTLTESATGAVDGNDEPVLGPFLPILLDDLRSMEQDGKQVSLPIHGKELHELEIVPKIDWTSDDETNHPAYYAFRRTFREKQAKNNAIRAEYKKTPPASATDFTLPEARVLYSAVDFAFQHYRLLYEAHKTPSKNFDQEYTENEVYVLHELPGYIFSNIRASENHGPFVMAHPDLRCPNIIVDEGHEEGDVGNFNIQGIIDWDGAGTVPRQFFLPPYWIGGTDVKYVTSYSFSSEFEEFREVLNAKLGPQTTQPSPPRCRSLNQLWSETYPKSVECALGFLLRYVGLLPYTFFSGVWSHRFAEKKGLVRQFFEQQPDDSAYVPDLQWRRFLHEKYRKYLEENGLLVESQEEASIKAKVKFIEDNRKLFFGDEEEGKVTGKSEDKKDETGDKSQE